MNLLLVKPGAEKFALLECKQKNIQAYLFSNGIIKINSNLPTTINLCFPFWLLLNVKKLDINEKTRSTEYAGNWFCHEIQNEKIDKPWFLFWLTCSDNGFTSDISKAEKLKSFLKKRISRVVKLSNVSSLQCDQNLNGFFIIDTKPLNKILVSREAVFFGQKRMKDDPVAPSRSYLKIEEAFSIFNLYPANGQTVVDLGAAPGGWTWAALKRGAIVYAVDNGPLKKGPLDHSNVFHIREDAYIWKPNSPVDWLFCDMVDQPFKVLDRIKKWFLNRWCKYAIVNLKYGFSDPAQIIDFVYSSKGLISHSQRLICRHLFHDRDEITVMAQIK